MYKQNIEAGYMANLDFKKADIPKELTGDAKLDIKILATMNIDDFEKMLTYDYSNKLLNMEETLRLLKKKNNMLYSSAKTIEEFLVDYNDIFYTKSCINYFTQDECIIKAIKDDDLEGLKTSLSYGIISNYNKILYYCAETGKLKAFYILLADLPQSVELHFEKLAELALMNGHIDFFDGIFEVGTNIDYNYIARYIAFDENIYLLKYLFTVAPIDYDWDYNTIVAAAAEQGDYSYILEVMDINQNKNYKWNYDDIIYHALFTNFDEAVKLVTNFKKNNIDFNFIVGELIIEKENEIIHKLLTGYRFYKWDILRLAELSIITNNLDVFKMFIEKFTVGDFTLMMDISIKFSRDIFVNFLFNKCSTSKKWGYGKLIKKAMLNSNVGIVQLILNRIPESYKLNYTIILNKITDDILEPMLSLLSDYASRKNDLDKFFRSLFITNNKKITKVGLDTILTEGHFKTLEELLIRYEIEGTDSLATVLFRLYPPHNWDIDYLIRVPKITDNQALLKFLMSKIKT